MERVPNIAILHNSLANIPTTTELKALRNMEGSPADPGPRGCKPQSSSSSMSSKEDTRNRLQNDQDIKILAETVRLSSPALNMNVLRKFPPAPTTELSSVPQTPQSNINSVVKIDPVPITSSPYYTPVDTSQLANSHWSTPVASWHSPPVNVQQSVHPAPVASSRYSSPVAVAGSLHSSPIASSPYSSNSSPVANRYSSPVANSRYSSPVASRYSSPLAGSRHFSPGANSRHSSPIASCQNVSPITGSRYSSPINQSVYPATPAHFISSQHSANSAPDEQSAYLTPVASSHYSTPASQSVHPGHFTGSPYSGTIAHSGYFAQNSAPVANSAYSSPAVKSEYPIPSASREYPTPFASTENLGAVAANDTNIATVSSADVIPEGPSWLNTLIQTGDFVQDDDNFNISPPPIMAGNTPVGSMPPYLNHGHGWDNFTLQPIQPNNFQQQAMNLSVNNYNPYSSESSVPWNTGQPPPPPAPYQHQHPSMVLAQGDNGEQRFAPFHPPAPTIGHNQNPNNTVIPPFPPMTDDTMRMRTATALLELSNNVGVAETEAHQQIKTENENIPPLPSLLPNNEIKMESENSKLSDNNTSHLSSSLVPVINDKKKKPFRGSVRTIVVKKRVILCKLCGLKVASPDKLLIHLDREHNIQVRGPVTIRDADEIDHKKENEKLSKLLQEVENKPRECEPRGSSESDSSSSSSSEETDDEESEENIESSDSGEGYNKKPTKPMSAKKEEKLKGKAMKAWEKSKLKEKVMQRCPKCYMDFNEERQYQHHMDKHKNGLFHSCPHCLIGFEFEHLLNVHLRGLQVPKIDLNLIPTHKCIGWECPAEFANRNCLLIHKTGHDQMHRCPQCEKPFVHYAVLRKHIHRIHNHDQRTVPCKFPGCFKSFGTRAGLLKHNARMHRPGGPCQRQRVTSSSSYSSDSSQNIHHLTAPKKKKGRPSYSKITQRKKLACPELECIRRFPNHIALNSHWKDDHNIDLEVQRPFCCSVSTCQARFKGKCYLTRHYQIFHPNLRAPGYPGIFMKTARTVIGNTRTWNMKKQKEYKYKLVQCPDCHKKVDGFIEFNIHLVKDHKINLELERPFKCTAADCHARFPGQKNLDRHYRMSHVLNSKIGRNMKKINCPVCRKWLDGYIEVNKHLVEEHKMDLEVERPFFCSLSACQARFLSKARLIRHYQLSHPKVPISGSGKLAETKQNKIVSNGTPQTPMAPTPKIPKARLTGNRSLKTGKGVQCPECKRMKTDYVELNIHLEKVHKIDLENERPWKCTVAGCHARLSGRTYYVRHYQHSHPEYPISQIPRDPSAKARASKLAKNDQMTGTEIQSSSSQIKYENENEKDFNEDSNTASSLRVSRDNERDELDMLSQSSETEDSGSEKKYTPRSKTGGGKRRGSSQRLSEVDTGKNKKRRHSEESSLNNLSDDRFSCEYCPKAYNHVTSLERHMRTDHNRPYKNNTKSKTSKYRKKTSSKQLKMKIDESSTTCNESESSESSMDFPAHVEDDDTEQTETKMQTDEQDGENQNLLPPKSKYTKKLRSSASSNIHPVKIEVNDDEEEEMDSTTEGEISSGEGEGEGGDRLTCKYCSKKFETWRGAIVHSSRFCSQRHGRARKKAKFLKPDSDAEDTAEELEESLHDDKLMLQTPTVEDDDLKNYEEAILAPIRDDTVASVLEQTFSQSQEIMRQTSREELSQTHAELVETEGEGVLNEDSYIIITDGEQDHSSTPSATAESSQAEEDEQIQIIIDVGDPELQSVSSDLIKSYYEEMALHSAPEPSEVEPEPLVESLESPFDISDMKFCDSAKNILQDDAKEPPKVDMEEENDHVKQIKAKLLTASSFIILKDSEPGKAGNTFSSTSNNSKISINKASTSVKEPPPSTSTSSLVDTKKKTRTISIKVKNVNLLNEQRRRAAARAKAMKARRTKTKIKATCSKALGTSIGGSAVMSSSRQSINLRSKRFKRKLKPTWKLIDLKEQCEQSEESPIILKMLKKPNPKTSVSPKGCKKQDHDYTKPGASSSSLNKNKSQQNKGKETKNLPFICAETSCPGQYSTQELLNAHTKYMHSEQSDKILKEMRESLQCPECKKEFIKVTSNIGNLIHHLNASHFEKEQVLYYLSKKSNSNSVRKTPKKGEPKAPCPHCGKIFFNRRNMLRHEKKSCPVALKH